MKKLLKWGGIAFIALIILGMIAGGSGSNDTNSSNSQTSSEGSSQSANASSSNKQMAKIYTIGEDVIVKDVKWKLVKAWKADQLTDYSGAVKPAGKFVVVNVTVENMDKEMKTASGLKLVDSQGREFISYSKAFSLQNLGAESLYLLSNLNPNVPYTFADVYEVPADAEGLKLKVGDLSLLGSDEALIDLGL